MWSKGFVTFVSILRKVSPDATQAPQRVSKTTSMRMSVLREVSWNWADTTGRRPCSTKSFKHPSICASRRSLCKASCICLVTCTAIKSDEGLHLPFPSHPFSLSAYIWLYRLYSNCKNLKSKRYSIFGTSWGTSWHKSKGIKSTFLFRVFNLF